MPSDSFQVTLNPNTDLEEEKALYLKAWERLSHHAALRELSTETPPSSIEDNFAKLTQQLKNDTVNHIRVEKNAKLIMSVFINTPNEIADSLLLRVLLTSNGLTEADSTAAWEMVLSSIRQHWPEQASIKMSITEGECEHATLLTKFGFRNTKLHPEKNVAAPLNLDDEALEYWQLATK